jgi:hypothetical protein
MRIVRARLFADEPRFAAPIFERWLEAQRRGRVELGLHAVEMFVALAKTLASAEAASAAMPDVQRVAQHLRQCGASSMR